MGNLREDVPPNRRIVSAMIGEHDDTADRHVVNVVADGSRRTRRGAVLDGEGATGESESGIDRLDVETLADDTEAIEGVAQRGGVASGAPRRGPVCRGTRQSTTLAPDFLTTRHDHSD